VAKSYNLGKRLGLFNDVVVLLWSLLPPLRQQCVPSFRLGIRFVLDLQPGKATRAAYRWKLRFTQPDRGRTSSDSFAIAICSILISRRGTAINRFTDCEKFLYSPFSCFQQHLPVWVSVVPIAEPFDGISYIHFTFEPRFQIVPFELLELGTISGVVELSPTVNSFQNP